MHVPQAMSSCAITYCYNTSRHKISHLQQNETRKSATMPQYDTYEEPPSPSSSSTSESSRSESPDSIEKPTANPIPQTKPNLRSQFPFQDDEIHQIGDDDPGNETLDSAMSSCTHGRHSSLRQSDFSAPLILSAMRTTDVSAPEQSQRNDSPSSPSALKRKSKITRFY